MSPKVDFLNCHVGCTSLMFPLPVGALQALSPFQMPFAQVRPLRRQLKTLKAWITGQRKDQSPGTRTQVPVAQVDPAFEGVEGGPGSLVKFNPLSNVTSQEVWTFLRVMVPPPLLFSSPSLNQDTGIASLGRLRPFQAVTLATRCFFLLDTEFLVAGGCFSWECLFR